MHPIKCLDITRLIYICFSDNDLAPADKLINYKLIINLKMTRRRTMSLKTHI